MKLGRLFKVVKRLNRIPEVLKCVENFDKAFEVFLIYTTLKKGRFPYVLTYRKNGNEYKITLPSWPDVTTAWVVLLTEEYRIFESDRTIVDLGANIGLFAIMAHSHNSTAQIISVEPFAATYQGLVENVANLNLQKYVETRELAVSGNEAEVFFDGAEGIPSHSQKIVSRESVQNPVSVPAKDLKQFLDDENLEEVDFLKMDVEGAEYAIIESASCETLRRLRRIGIEYHRFGLERIDMKMREAGFELTYHPKKGRSGVAEYTRV